ncbi:hypothetical protein MARPO_0058s0071 [Marchantia polymorpha]|uniref:Unconventional SNARE in the ER 1B n=1 Tax=Marchantia polymorpha TaxID=3197 RepID=A0A0H5BJB2_MARPO|nr:hypothetical protein MARPO_0058s0071 [Marchantia polymorpha]BAS01245.1 unconventional SNARE in the ER 1B [Marchantia polymorpha]|eukprot:PTQ37287.1 hypothetical protein MARPO_0058s0071 [Marchantia polymorpha]
MILSRAEIRLRRLLAAVPQQTNKHKQVHYVTTLKELLATLKKEAAQSSHSTLIEAKAEVYSRYIEEMSHKLDASRMEDVWDSLGSERGPEGSDQCSTSSCVKELAHVPSTSDLPLFPSCLKRKHSPDPQLLLSGEVEESNLADTFEADIAMKKVRVDFNEYEAKSSEEPMHLEQEVQSVEKSRQEVSRIDAAEVSYEPQSLELEAENALKARQEEGTDKVVTETSAIVRKLECEIPDVVEWSYTGSREEEVERLDSDSRLYISKHQIEQEKLVSEMLLLTEHIKESSLLLGSSLHVTEELLDSSEMTIRHCLSATTSANMKIGELFTRSQTRDCGCVTWVSLFLMYLTFLTMVVIIRLT